MNEETPKKGFMGSIVESIKKPFLSRPEEDITLSSTPKQEHIEQYLDDIIPTGFFDNGVTSMYSATGNQKHKNVQEQNNIINAYRKVASYPEVQDAINEIVDEAIFSPGSKDIIAMDFGKDITDNIKVKFNDELKDILNKINIEKNIYSMFLNYYIDGQLNVHCAYNDNDLGGGIQKLSILSPLGLNFNYTKDRWEYTELSTNSYGTVEANKDVFFDREEIIRIDSGIYNNNIILGNLHHAIKPANMLNTLEDMLIPMRFSRSVSRRIFNVDVSNLNNAKAEQVLKAHQAKFKYQKFYDLETGTISNQQHVASLTEDYWFPNRDGAKGTTVDTIDETGNLGELDDLLYFKRKLYTALKVPSNRINDGGDADGEFDFGATSVSREELKFFNFISRLRNLFLELFYELLKRQILAKGIATDSEWSELLPDFSIKFVSENKFFENMERDRLSDSLNLLSDMEPLLEKQMVSYEYLFKNVLRMSDEDITEMSEQIEKEKTNPLYKRFYEVEED